MECSRRKCASSNPPCDVQRGNCGTGGCQPGYQGVDCTQVCIRDKYGSACSLLCSARHCDGYSTCDHIYGRCVNRCQAGWTGTDCITACSSGNNYGPNCEKFCVHRHCVSSSSCYITTGVCDAGGCQAGWMGVDCAQGNDFFSVYTCILLVQASFNLCCFRFLVNS
ncbi:multiple epidermal growth factor-like domains protein 10 [Gigantopelta aegis]|uniref:multiple epidermal growth factor-like domains protein 10 n=1 Tax=Gigantopelta aegis TaxID=1735272 RepID=UPI001B88A2EB|nr:multiple epidermal growth factor-like domains protein 10 [Gigantopelta aegis]